jgi:AraC-like DNA-binding protein
MLQYNLINSHKFSETKRIQFEINDQIKLELIGFLSCPTSWIGDYHMHPFWEIIYVNNGNGVMRYRERDHSFKSNDIIILEPYSFHELTNENIDGLELIYIGFSLDFDTSSRIEGEEIPCVLDPSPVGEIIKNNLRNIVQHLIRMNEEDTFHLNNRVIFDIILMITRILPLADEKIKSWKKRRKMIIAEKVQRYLESNISRSVNIQEIADFLYLSPRYCNSIFKEAVGTSLKAYHNHLRMFYAGKLLRDTESFFTISEIAYKLGYNSVHYFSKAFKNYYHVSPSSFRNPKT